MTVSTAAALLKEGCRARREDRPADARVSFAEAVEQCRGTDDKTMLAQALAGLGQIERDLGQLDAAVKLYAEAVELYRTVDRPLALAHTVRHLADILRHQVQLDLAAPHYREALAIYRSHEETPPLDLANALRGYALLKSSEGEAEEATRLWREASGLYAAAGVEAGVVESQVQIERLTA
ncbi:MAG: tetratricopeptide repeat protein [Terracidiphilus sp.]